MDFYIGQRVRIIGPDSTSFKGATATVYDIQRPPGLIQRLFGERGMHWAPECASRHGIHPKETAYLLDVDGVGRFAGWGFDLIGFPYYWLRPLDDPKESAWADEAVKKVTKPQHIEPVAPKKTDVHAQNSSEKT